MSANLCWKLSEVLHSSQHFSIVRQLYYCPLGIPDEVFIELKDLRVRELDKILESEHTALDFLQRHVDEYGISISLADLVKRDF